MAGYDLKEESYIQKQLTEDELWSIFSGMFSNKVSRDTSYKFGFFKSILDNLFYVLRIQPSFVSSNNIPYLHPYRSADIFDKKTGDLLCV